MPSTRRRSHTCAAWPTASASGHDLDDLAAGRAEARGVEALGRCARVPRVDRCPALAAHRRRERGVVGVPAAALGGDWLAGVAAEQLAPALPRLDAPGFAGGRAPGD